MESVKPWLPLDTCMVPTFLSKGLCSECRYSKGCTCHLKDTTENAAQKKSRKKNRKSKF